MKRYILPLLVLTLIGAGCSSKSSRPEPKGPQPATTAQGLKYDLNAASRIPADFPTDIPQYPGGKIITAMNVGGIATLTQDTKAKPADVIAWAKQQFTTAGASKTNEIEQDRGGVTLEFTKGSDIFRVRVDVARDGVALLTIIKQGKG